MMKPKNSLIEFGSVLEFSSRNKEMSVVLCQGRKSENKRWQESWLPATLMHLRPSNNPCSIHPIQTILVRRRSREDSETRRNTHEHTATMPKEQEKGKLMPQPRIGKKTYWKARVSIPVPLAC
jgi:hypothetical protein